MRTIFLITIFIFNLASAFAGAECNTQIQCKYGSASCSASAIDRKLNQEHSTALCGVIDMAKPGIRSCSRSFINKNDQWETSTEIICCNTAGNPVSFPNDGSASGRIIDKCVD